MAVGLTVAIAHHPDRDHLLPELLRRLHYPGGTRASLEEPVDPGAPEPDDVGAGAREVVVVTDPEPDRRDAWLNAKEAWRAGIELGGTHHLVLENDIVPCRDFLTAAARAIAARPDSCVRFYSMGTEPSETVPFARARARGEPWVPLSDWAGAQAVVLPAPWIEAFLHWGESFPREHGGYPDSRLRGWLQARKRGPAWTTVPCLVQHGGGASLAGSPPHQATWFIGAEESALEIDWAA